MYKIKATIRAKKELKALKQLYREAIAVAVEEIKEDPFLGKPLNRELQGKFVYKIHLYRIIYSVNTKDKMIMIISVGYRGIIYE